MNINKVKKDFPIFRKNPELCYLDSSASSLKPKVVTDKLREYYEEYSSNIFRGLYPLSQKATEEYENTRKICAEFIHAKNANEIIFTRNTTESLNLLCYSLGKNLSKGDEIITTIAEHHSNFVPWQQMAMEKGLTFTIAELNENGILDFKKLKEILSKKTKIFTLTHISNVLGTINPIKEIVAEVKKFNPEIMIILDAAQSIPHMEIDVQDLGIDFMAFSGHKMLGPTGVGVLWGKEERLKNLSPFLFGGEMVRKVNIQKTYFCKSPHKFEAGTPAIGEVIAFQEAMKYLETIGFKEIETHEKKLTNYAMRRLQEEFQNEISFLGPVKPELKTGIIAFNLKNLHSHDISDILGEENVCVRAGLHCAQPLHESLNLTASLRASFYLYNDFEDIEKLIKGLKKVKEILQ